ncbi:hypothetical protein [Flavobacterium sp. HSC-61S13]|uniref:hypothetical protein n=1 Tax=Flavobacterium sp. HSC-61S13 TaxID=2910963 RepID=UPI00209DC7F6|nr:hypothetical protein [Flavobacterium sp. HSC-61S13]MCP1996744.1 hypothetical protein [Flavobacterium sp. HSC-61S13]
MNSFSQTLNIDDPSQFIGSLINTLATGVLKALVIFLYIFLCWGSIKLISLLTKKLFVWTRIEKIQHNFNDNEFLNKAKIKLNLMMIIDAFIKVFFALVFMVIGADMFGLEIVSAQVGNFVALIPQFFISLLIFISGLYLASWLKRAMINFLAVVGFRGAKLLGQLVFYVMFLFVTIVALNQAGINTDIITHNISIIIGAVFVAIALSLGMGSKELVTLLLYSFYARKNLKVGKRIRINELEGIILSIDNIYLCLDISGKNTLIPIKNVSYSVIEFLDN